MNFYAPRCIDKVSGGYINCFLDDGTVCDYETKQLVGQARFVFIFSAAALLEPGQAYRQLAETSGAILIPVRPRPGLGPEKWRHFFQHGSKRAYNRL
ncbi:AGE family epimerase/isomerase [Heyndrickxia coagulans]|uniref:AGE family epimerase/isomerase n=1 Tax=Heyndrickxia coagulans TaxID=1398 RepID=UPI00352E6EC7